ncbi:hypothetical protein AQJ43_29985 [Streptomyces avermitilis]|nr:MULTISPECIES: hypothetical protein [Streptomyces]KUN50995.1 hypothetical protein AQJ43_29985 [Streptomyces avermitilis]MYS96119.1 hypothetical protein [Streptomyces sp. SID5469]GDY69718.1 hypothetical protein SAV14893_091110 [Streptomyces avermitilis]GDY79970.1 hypothetical protein SAV31267_094550 [Streptomyces avermitilis]
MWRTWANEEFFGRQAGGRGESAFAQARVVALAECGTHAVFGAVIGPAVGGRAELSRQLFPQLGEGKLLLADQGFYGFELWQTARATGADLLWRLRSSAAVPGLQVLDDGSYLSSIRAEADRTVLTAGAQSANRSDRLRRLRLPAGAGLVTLHEAERRPLPAFLLI